MWCIMPYFLCLFPTSSILVLSCFFFYSSGDPRDLHSFPTRRSSDLHPVGAVVEDDDRERQRVAHDRLKLLDIELEDRKSTRLNSSHRCISYAVFCLKKKKVNKADTHTHSA